MIGCMLFVMRRRVYASLVATSEHDPGVYQQWRPNSILHLSTPWHVLSIRGIICYQNMNTNTDSINADGTQCGWLSQGWQYRCASTGTRSCCCPPPRSAPRVAAQLIRKLNAFFERLERSVWKTATRFLENCNAVF